VQSTCGELSIADNMYTFSTRQHSIYAPALQKGDAHLQIETNQEWETSLSDSMLHTLWTRNYNVTNQGESVALHIYPYESSDRYWITASEAYFTLFPGESIQVTVTCCRQEAELLSIENSDHSTVDIELPPEIVFTAFQQHDSINERHPK